MKCQRTACGREIQEDALYCPYCGKKQQRTAAPKPRKRANGKGCIYRSGKTWTIQVRVVRNGTIVYARKKCGFPTRAAAEEYLDTYTRTGVAPRSMRLIDCWAALQQTKSGRRSVRTSAAITAPHGAGWSGSRCRLSGRYLLRCCRS